MLRQLQIYRATIEMGKPNSLANRLARSRASVNRGMRVFSNNNLAKLYTPSSRTSTENNAGSVNNSSPRSWGSINTAAYRNQEEKEKREAREKQERIAAALARAKQGSPTGKSNISWIKKPTGGTRRKTRRCWSRKGSTRRR